jgi:hypothetical protein
MEEEHSKTKFLTFPAEIRQVSSRKLASLDIEYKVVLTTYDPSVLNLGALRSDMMVDVSVELGNE